MYRAYETFRSPHTSNRLKGVYPQQVIDAMIKPFESAKVIAGTVRVSLDVDRSELIGNCPTCSSRLSVEIRADGSFGNLVACMRCKEIYRIELEGAATSTDERLSGFRVSYAVTGPWDVASIMEYLFDNVGAVNLITAGFECRPDEYHTDFPTITVNEHDRTVCFGLFGNYAERQAGAIINQVVSEFGARFRLEMAPLVMERWEARDEGKRFDLVERRPLGTLLRDRIRRQARA